MTVPMLELELKRPSYGKDKSVNTTFLPDIGRDIFIRELKKQFTGTCIDLSCR
jgi:hypothetical protein